MVQPGLSAEEVMAWVEKTSSNWRDLIAAHPEILGLPCDIMDVHTAGGLLQHIVAVEVRYAERLAGLPATDYANVPYDSAEALYATHARAFALLREQLAADVNWEEWIELQTRSMGPARSTRRTVLFHLLFHSIRHYAQLATLVRQHGIKPGAPMDYLMMQLEKL
jgi:uncharacterized damage-inducible protein DinB